MPSPNWITHHLKINIPDVSYSLLRMLFFNLVTSAVDKLFQLQDNLYEAWNTNILIQRFFNRYYILHAMSCPSQWFLLLHVAGAQFLGYIYRFESAFSRPYHHRLHSLLDRSFDEELIEAHLVQDHCCCCCCCMAYAASVSLSLKRTEVVGATYVYTVSFLQPTIGVLNGDGATVCNERTSERTCIVAVDNVSAWSPYTVRSAGKSIGSDLYHAVYRLQTTVDWLQTLCEEKM